MKETIRVTVPVPERSTSSSFSTTAASSAAPTTQGTRAPRRAPNHIATSAVSDQSRAMPLCTASEPSQASTRYGTPS